MEQYIKIMNEDDDKDTVSQVCSSIVEVIKSVTYDSVEKCKKELITSPLCFIFLQYSEKTQYHHQTWVQQENLKNLHHMSVCVLQSWSCCVPCNMMLTSFCSRFRVFFYFFSLAFFIGIFCVWLFSL
jgi:hypothetical protein